VLCRQCSSSALRECGVGARLLASGPAKPPVCKISCDKPDDPKHWQHHVPLFEHHTKVCSWPIYGKPARGLARQKAHSPRRQRIGDCWMRTRVNERERRVSALTNNRVRQLHSWHHQLEFFVIHRLQPGNLHVEVDIRRCRVLLLTDSILSASIRPPPHHPST
jgi:hypothetical protein